MKPAAAAWCPFQSADNMLSKWKHAIILIFCVLLVCGALANSQVRGSVSESLFKKVISSTGGFTEIVGRVRVTFPRGFFANPKQSAFELAMSPRGMPCRLVTPFGGSVAHTFRSMC